MKLRKFLKKEYNIYCDLDDVLVDFLKGVQEKVNPEIATRSGWQKVKKEDWKKVIEMSPQFWADLEWTQDGKQLWNYIKDYNPIILSARPKTDKMAEKGKQSWIRNHLGAKFSNSAIITLGIFKQKYADEHSILIDDYNKNINQWKNNGGIGILHKDAHTTIEQLKKLGL